MTPKQEAALRLAREALKLNCSSQTESPATKALAAIDEALTEQQSGIKQVIELYDSPEQPAQQDYWQEEARRYAQNAEFWRGKYEAATAQQQEPVATLDDIQQEIYENTREFVSLNVMEWMLKRYYTPPASKPFVGLTDEDLAGCDDEELKQARYWEAKLKEKNNG